MTTNIQILGIAGSLRASSYNKALIQATQNCLPESASLETFDLSSIPMFNQDLEEASVPDVVNHFRSAIKNADALLIATPEYNGSIPGVLKNALEWASRHNDYYADTESPLNNKPVAIMGASPWQDFGTIRAQTHLRFVVGVLGMNLLTKPYCMVGSASGKFDQDSNLIDDRTFGHVSALVQSLVDWTRQLLK